MRLLIVLDIISKLSISRSIEFRYIVYRIAGAAGQVRHMQLLIAMFPMCRPSTYRIYIYIYQGTWYDIASAVEVGHVTINNVGYHV